MALAQVVVDYLKVAAETDNVFQNTKYNVSRMLPTKCDDSDIECTGESAAAALRRVTVADLGATKSNAEMFALWDLQHSYEQTQARFVAKARALNLPTGDGIVDDSFNSAPPPAHAYDDAFVTQHQFYCATCHVQLLSDKDVALHTKGKKHKKKLRERSAATVSEQIAKSAVAATATATALAAPSGDESTHDADESDRAAKRVKRAADNDSDVSNAELQGDSAAPVENDKGETVAAQVAES